MHGFFPIVVVFRGMPSSLALHALIERQARRLQESMPGLEVLQLRATVERREWPSRPPTAQARLELSLATAVLTGTAGDFGRSNALLAIEAAFEDLRGRVARLPLEHPLPRATLSACARAADPTQASAA